MKKMFNPTETNPPDFYQDDMKKWESKFRKSIQDRQDYKKKQDKHLNGPHPNFGLTQEQIQKKPEIKKRPPSRYSKKTFDKLDFNCSGNTEHVSLF